MQPPTAAASREPLSARDPFHRMLGALQRGFNTIAGKIVLLFLLATLAPLGVALRQTQADLVAAERRAVEGAGSAASRAADEVQGALEAGVQVARILGRYPPFWEGSDTARDEILRAYAAPPLNNVIFFTDDFQSHGASNQQAGAPRSDVADRPYAQEAVARRQLTVGLQPNQASDLNPILPLVLPVREEGGAGRSGFLIVELRLGPLPVVWVDEQQTG
jgi:hypothetical protein